MSEPDEGKNFFHHFEEHMRVLSPPVQLGLKRDISLIVLVGLGLLLVIVPLGQWFEKAVTWLRLAGATLQLLGLILFTYRQARDVVPEFVDAKRKFAAELDDHFAKRQRVLAWLREAPSGVRESRLAYVEARLEAIRSRYSLIFGAVDRLGVLPVLVGVFIQFQALKSLSWPALYLGVFIVALYLVSLWVSRHRVQLEGYASLLRAAMQPSAALEPNP